MDPVLEYTSICLLACLVTVSTIANVLALLAYCRRTGLQKNVSDRFVVNVMAGDVAMCACATWAAWETLSNDGKGGLRLEAAESAACGMAAATLYGVLLVAADQHRAVTDPLRYRSASHRRRPALAAAGAWAAAATCGAARAAAGSAQALAVLPAFRWTYLFVAIVPPALAVICMNARIYCAARCSRAATPGAGAIAVARGSTSAGRASAAAALLGALHVPHALASALLLDPYSRAVAFALLAMAACLAPFPLALRSRRVRRELRLVLRVGLRAAPPRNASAGALRLLAASDVEKAERASSVVELTAGLSLPVGRDDARASFSSGASTQLSAASDE